MMGMPAPLTSHYASPGRSSRFGVGKVQDRLGGTPGISVPTPGLQAPPEVLAAVRRTVRGILEKSPGMAQASPELRQSVARKLVDVAMMGANLMVEEQRLTTRAQQTAGESPTRAVAHPMTASALEFGEATKAAGKTFQDIRAAIDFPTYVTSLITGVFQAISTSNINQLTAISDLLDNVSASQDEFESSNVRDHDVVVWVVQKFPFITSTDGTDLVLADDVNLDDKKAILKSTLNATDAEMGKIDADDLMGSLGTLARRRMARDRQQVLGTLVQMGLQRIVVDEGRLHASMEMRVDTRSAAERDRASRNEAWLETGASANVGVGMWGASAHVNTGFSSVQSDHEYSKEEIATRAGLRSSVDLAFRTEQIPLDKFANEKARVKLDANARVPMSVSDGKESLLSSEKMEKPTDMKVNIVKSDEDSKAATKAREDAAKREKEKEDAAAKKAEEEKKQKAEEEKKKQAEEEKKRKAEEEKKKPAAESKPAPNGTPAPGK
jgi:hypothetical protein